MMILIGVTGGVGMGKSTSASILQDRGFPLIDTDQIARDIVEPGQPALETIRQVFGDAVIDAEGRLRRDALAMIVFSDPTPRKQLEAITHPLIRQRWVALARSWEAQGEKVGFVVIPLLYETAAQGAFASVVCVACSPVTQARRLALRGWSKEESQRRVEAQLPIEQKISLANQVVWTEGDLTSHGRQWTLIVEGWIAPNNERAS